MDLGFNTNFIVLIQIHAQNCIISLEKRIKTYTFIKSICGDTKSIWINFTKSIWTDRTHIKLIVKPEFRK